MRIVRKGMVVNVVVICAAPETETESEAPGKKPRQGITPEIIKELTECNARLSGQRKRRQVCCVIPFVQLSFFQKSKVVEINFLTS